MYKITLTLDKEIVFEDQITFNYSNFFIFLDKRKGLRWLNKKVASDCIPRLKYAIQFLGVERFLGKFHIFLDVGFDVSEEENVLLRKATETDLDAPGNEDLLAELISRKMVSDTGGIWKGTPGNAGYALNEIVKQSEKFPTAIWTIET